MKPGVEVCYCSSFFMRYRSRKPRYRNRFQLGKELASNFRFVPVLFLPMHLLRARSFQRSNLRENYFGTIKSKMKFQKLQFGQFIGAMLLFRIILLRSHGIK